MPLPRKVQAVVFDMDGLMFNTEVLYRDAILAVAAEKGLELLLPFVLKTIGLSGDATRATYQEHFGPEFDFEAFWVAVTERFELTKTQLVLKAGVAELLATLDELHLPRAIATSSRHENVQHHLAAFELLNRFQTVVARGDYVNGKPNPEPFLVAANRLKVDPSFCVALEDSYNGVRAASGAGMMTIMVPDLLEPTAEMETLYAHLANDLHAVQVLIKAQF